MAVGMLWLARLPMTVMSPWLAAMVPHAHSAIRLGDF